MMVRFSSKCFNYIKTSFSMPKILKLGNYDSNELEQLGIGVANLLKSGKIIAVPTDTIYGIACLAQNSQAIQNILRIKVRDCQKPLAICVADIGDVQKWGKITFPISVLEQLLPGPVTVILERQQVLNPKLNPGVSSVAIRIPKHNFVRQLCRSASGPLALTSANISGGMSSLAIEEFKDLWQFLDLIIDGGVLGDVDPKRLGSTIISLEVNGCYKIIRDGCWLSETVEVLKKYDLKPL